MVLLALLLAACGSPPAPEAASSPGVVSVEEGRKVFQQSCATCHGRDARGIANLGKDLAASPWLRSHTDREVEDLIRQGRALSDPENTTRAVMPPMGGNPSLTDSQVSSVVRWLRTLAPGQASPGSEQLRGGDLQR